MKALFLSLLTLSLLAFNSCNKRSETNNLQTPDAEAQNFTAPIDSWTYNDKTREYETIFPNLNLTNQDDLIEVYAPIKNHKGLTFYHTLPLEEAGTLITYSITDAGDLKLISSKVPSESINVKMVNIHKSGIISAMNQHVYLDYTDYEQVKSFYHLN